jgi:hypothetical protein
MGNSLAFGCPECGSRIDLGRNSPGRQVRCGRCRTLVEVPFFPRNFGRRRNRKPRWRAWLPVVIVGLAVVGGPLVAWRWWESSARSGHRADLDRALASAEEAEARGDLAAALLALEEAREIASGHGLEPPGGLPGLASRRDELSRLDGEARLEALPSLPPDLAFDEARSLSSRVATDPALADLSGRASRALGSAADRWVDAHLARARQECDAGRPAEAMAELERLASGLDSLSDPAASAARDRVRSFAAGLIGRVGARIGPIVVDRRGPVPSGGLVEADLLPVLAGALADRGYLVTGPDSPLAGLADRSPYRLGASIQEREGATYRQSPNRTTLFTVDLTFDRLGESAWAEHFEARTRVPLAGLSAMEGSRLELASSRSPEVEERLYQDARLDLAEKLRLKLKALPPAP